MCSFEGQIWAIGGTNGWKCLTDTEVYDAETDTWSPGPPLNIPRRGPGVAVYDGMFCITAEASCVAQLVRRLSKRQEVLGSNPVRPHNFVSPSADSRRAVGSYL